MQIEDRPNFVSFETRAVEDRAASRAAGHYVAKDVHIVKVTMPGGNMVHEDIAEDWIAKKARMGDKHADTYRRAYEAWKQGQEVPVEGTAIKHCPIFSPAEIENCAHLKIYVLEDLATLPEQGIQKLGMGGRSMVNRARAYLEGADKGKVAAQIDDLSLRLAELTRKLEEKDSQIAELEAALEKPRRGRPPKDEAA